MVKADETLDTRKKVCPIPVLLTKRKLQAMPTGTVLEVIGDYKSTVENIKRFSKQHGYKVLRVVREFEAFRIYIKKEKE